MQDLSSYIKNHREFLFHNIGNANDGSKTCKYYKGNDACAKIEGCYCKKIAEIKGSIDYFIPKEYRDLTINNATGFITTRQGERKQVWSDVNKKEIQKLLREYLFGGTDVALLCDRESCNKASRMDMRFHECENVVIHGNVVRKKINGLPSQPLPSGKTLIACLILKEAIWRRLFVGNKADTYNFISYQTLRFDMKHKRNNIDTIKETDWLVIDDVSLPVNENNFDHQEFVANFDDFLMTRMENRLPTVLVCEFDALSTDYSAMLGYSFQKLVTIKNTWHIRVGESSANE